MIFVSKMSNVSMNARFAYSTGTVPEIRSLKSICMILSIERFPSSVGRLPERSLLVSDKASSSVQLPSSDGMLPSIPALCCSQRSTDSGSRLVVDGDLNFVTCLAVAYPSLSSNPQ